MVTEDKRLVGPFEPIWRKPWSYNTSRKTWNTAQIECKLRNYRLRKIDIRQVINNFLARSLQQISISQDYFMKMDSEANWEHVRIRTNNKVKPKKDKGASDERKPEILHN